jgi:hypothetical protein
MTQRRRLMNEISRTASALEIIGLIEALSLARESRMRLLQEVFSEEVSAIAEKSDRQAEPWVYSLGPPEIRGDDRYDRWYAIRYDPIPELIPTFSTHF